jgi:hypothetical protein
MDGAIIPVSDFTSPFHAIIKRYPMSKSSSRTKNRIQLHDFTANKIHIIASKMSIKYAGIWRSVRGNGKLAILF